MPDIVVLGAGYAGVLAAKAVAKRFRRNKDVNVTIIDKNPFHTMLTELHEVAAQRVEEGSIRISLAKVFAHRRVNVVQDVIESVDYASNGVCCKSGKYKYDYLVVATGSKPAFYGVDGAAEFCYTLWSYEDAIRLRERIEECFRKAATEPDIDKKREWLTFVTVGAGFTGVEMAGELAELVPIMCDRFEVDNSLVTQYCVDILSKVCPVLPDKQTVKVGRRLEKMGVTVSLGTGVKSVNESGVTIEKDGKPSQIKSGTVIWTAGVTGGDVSANASAAGNVTRGRLTADKYLRAQKAQNVYVIGDALNYTPDGEKAPVPQMVENAEASAETAAHNIAAAITGAKEGDKHGPHSYAPKFHGVMVSVGGRWGTAHVGTANRKFGMPSLLAMFSKHFINILYFIKVLGWNKIYSYIRHEFLTVRNNRSFVGGHFSNKGSNVWGVPLRVFLGFYWLYEGLVKVGEGWLKEPHLYTYMNSARQWFTNILNGVVPDVAASATGASGGAGVAPSVLINWNIFGLIKPLLVNNGQVGLRFQIPFMDYMLDKFVLYSSTMNMVMQIVICVTEILIGLALMGGLFTNFAAIAGLMLQIMFLTSTGLYMESWWMIPASVAVLFGAGRVLSLDYYVQPILKRVWRRIPFIGKRYLYND